jgi:hypothetical protein
LPPDGRRDRRDAAFRPHARRRPYLRCSSTGGANRP